MVSTGLLGIEEKMLEDKEEHPSSFLVNLAHQQWHQFSCPTTTGRLRRKRALKKNWVGCSRPRIIELIYLPYAVSSNIASGVTLSRAMSLAGASSRTSSTIFGPFRQRGSRWAHVCIYTGDSAILRIHLLMGHILINRRTAWEYILDYSNSVYPMFPYYIEGK